MKLLRRNRRKARKDPDVDLERFRIVRTKSADDDKSSSRHVDDQEGSAVSVEYVCPSKPWNIRLKAVSDHLQEHLLSLSKHP
jgi:hypothetical protein